MEKGGGLARHSKFVPRACGATPRGRARLAKGDGNRMPGGGNRQLRVRLPSDHWVWRLTDPAVRRREVERALEFYAHLSGRMDELRQAMEWVRKALEEGRLTLDAAGKKQDASQTDERLLAAVDKFLAVDKLLGF